MNSQRELEKDATFHEPPFYQLVPDCMKLILKFHHYEIEDRFFTEGSFARKSFPELQFAMEHFSCEANPRSIGEEDLSFFRCMHSIDLGFAEICAPPSIFHHFENLHQLRVRCCEDFTDECLQNMESLETLQIDHGMEHLTDEAFSRMKNLRNLSLHYTSQISDQIFEKLYIAGNRLKKLKASRCDHMTDRSLSFLKGIEELDISYCTLISDEGLKHVSGSIRKINISGCEQLTSEAFQHLRGLEELRMDELVDLDCHRAFIYLEGSIRRLQAVSCDLPTLDVNSLRYLAGITELNLSFTYADNLTDEAFRHVEGSIKRMDLKKLSGNKLSKKLVWYLSGIEKLDISYTGIELTVKDLPRLKQVFSKVSELVLDNSHEWDLLVKLAGYVERKGGKFSY